jgi:hypothetical protein
MRVIVPVRILLACEVGAILGFLGVLQFQPMKFELDTGMPIGREVLFFVSVALLVLGAVGMIVALVWCMVAFVGRRRRATASPPTGS